MRLDRITIGTAKDSATHSFKNLKNVTVDFDQDHWITVLIGWNGTGKSNVIEALAIIFRDLIQGVRRPKFAYNLSYRMGVGPDTLHINIDADPDRKRDAISIHLATEAEARGDGTLDSLIDGGPAFSALRGKRLTLKTFFEDSTKYLPHYVFAYYSGESDRLYEVFKPYLEVYDRQLRQGKDPGLKRLFYALPVHSQFVLLAFLIQQSEEVRDFLGQHLGIDPDEGIESVLFVLRQPPWQSLEGDPRFWNAKGVVADFLDRLQRIALAPVETTRRVDLSLWSKETLTFKYLYVKDIASLRDLVGDQRPAEFFRDMESTHVSQLIEEVRIRVRLKKNDGTVTFRELSEGEQQLLTVLGLLRFTAEKESLFLLDEPDTHLNPRWAVDYLSYLRNFAGQNDTNRDDSHILITTHNPLAIAELVKEQVQILHRTPQSAIVSENPVLDPKGMGFANIVTSDMFGLGTSLDNKTNDSLIELHKLSVKSTLTDSERSQIKNLRESLENLDFNFATRDRLEQEFLRARFDLAAPEGIDGAIVTPENKVKAIQALVTGLLSEGSEGGV
ncbi:AAA family ATPase [Sphingomonas faeni]|uniref:AAA family ATPase n=1 Tax=Sphingomonas faeni TaxID=185950 RepID=UPI0020BF949A|nr:AAA family ATPase [Sphingomonas faeni]MCK8458308.1 AAA family ATPase [Sphingomonas faeni]